MKESVCHQEEDAVSYVYQKQMLSRFLYPNPVCLLTLGTETGNLRNVMTISWLTPIDNDANILLSINSSRFTAKIVKELDFGSPFVLNVPTADMKDLIWQVGKCSGETTDKINDLDMPTCAPGWRPLAHPKSGSDFSGSKLLGTSRKEENHKKREAIMEKCFALSDCVAHIVCTLVQVNNAASFGFSDSDHIILSATICCAFAKNTHWDGKTFSSLSLSHQPILSFLGTGQFAHIVRGSCEENAT